MLVIALKIVAAFVFFAYWWTVSYDIRVCNYQIISNTSLQFKQCIFVTEEKHTWKNEYMCDIMLESSLYVNYRKTVILRN